MDACRLLVEGRVQRVGYRDWAVKTAKELNITGWIRNLQDGRVEILAAGDAGAVEAFTEACHEGPRAAQVSRVDVQAEPSPRMLKGFTKRFTA
ncbi:acylphosphatase [Stakelama sp. CBK3Z-3]|uniref:acylphosphatase n=1 Tax=Stakelama flava TaxID=2860338 RepID=A0ABS6XN49_9SPHN|nr:acylphosphatase [Stakelama flava]MBW4330870.1 acylphosphatase [Stakelama flava]